MMAQGWALFEESGKGAGKGDLPQMLHHLRGVPTLTLPPPQPAPAPLDVPQGQSTMPRPSPVKEENREDQPVVVMVGGTHSLACPQCNMVRGSKNGCDAHIRQAHTGKALVCALCSFSTYNMDLLQRHKKEHNNLNTCVFILFYLVSSSCFI